MTLQVTATLLALSLLAPSAPAADAANMSGTWVLNVKRSRWGKKPPPKSVEVRVEHKEPSLKYSGSATDSVEGQPTQFEFAGAIDGKEYPLKSAMAGKESWRRVDGNTVEVKTRSDDGKIEEMVTMTVSRNGKTLERKIKSKGPDGSAEWTEIYEKQ